MICSTDQTPRTLDDYTLLETRNLWIRVKGNLYTSDFIPIDPIREGSIEKTKAYLRKMNSFIQNLPRSNSLNERIVTFALKSSISLPGINPVIFADTNESYVRFANLAEKIMPNLRFSDLAKLRKQEDFVIILKRLALNDGNLDEADLEDTFYLEEIKKDLSSIQVLDLSKTYITTFPATLSPYLQNVRFINLSENNLGNTPLRFLDTLFRLPLLEALDLSFNSFSQEDWARIETLLPLLKNLRAINLRCTNLQEAPDSFLVSLFQLSLLVDLDLSYNCLSKETWAHIETLLPSIPNIQSIYLRASNLKNAPDSFLVSLFKRSCLKKLDVSSNGFSIETIVKIVKVATLKEISINT